MIQNFEPFHFRLHHRVQSVGDVDDDEDDGDDDEDAKDADAYFVLASQDL